MNKSPLRYPGGKSKALKQILPRIPKDITEFREPFVGGGSVFLNTSARQHWVNDLNTDVALFWEAVRDKNAVLTRIVDQTKRNHPYDGRALYDLLKKVKNNDPTYKAAAFFILNRITFAGVGSYSQTAFDGRFTESSIQRITDLAGKLGGVHITNSDYSKLLSAPGKGIFIFLDPPYLSARKSKLYQGHMEFDHVRLAQSLVTCKHDWLMTLDNSEEIRDLYQGWASIEPWELQYGMSKKKGKELFIWKK